MVIAKDKVVSVSYELRKSYNNGEIVEQVNNENPLQFLYNSGNLLPKFEAQLSGLKKGEKFEFTLVSEDAYGAKIDENLIDLPLDIFKVKGQIDHDRLRKGNVIPMKAKDGNTYQGTVIDTNDESVKIDFNHPLAGDDLCFAGEVVDVREATDDELKSGQVGHSCQKCGKH